MWSLVFNFRMKIYIVWKMVEKLIFWLKLILEYKGIKDQVMICVIGWKVKILVEVMDLDILEIIVFNVENDLVKGFLINVLVEFIYVG